ncbi:hypothetical protein [Nonomuraea sp. B19D2]|uniref:hypothetical protein n=1 Tax=Nonomuraea sp. B19D2 TaxID=3159561 RepID=UPI0032D9CC30
MTIVENENVAIRGMIDADSEYLLQSKRYYPSKIHLTDWRSLESYVLSEDCLDRTLRLGCAIENVRADSLFHSIAGVVRELSAIRFLSESENLGLPVGQYKWLRHITCDPRGVVSADVDGILRILMQGARISLRQLPDIKEELTSVKESLAPLDDLYVLHGRDFMQILTRQLRAMGVKIDDAGRMMWTAFQTDRLEIFPNLRAVVRYLCDPITEVAK